MESTRTILGDLLATAPYSFLIFMPMGAHMKKLLSVVLCSLSLLFASGAAFAKDVFVQGYTRSDGTYVQPHYRTAPDGNPYNNYSTRGNVNPYTGQAGTKDPYGYSNSYGNNSGYGYDRKNTNPYDSYDPYGQ